MHNQVASSVIGNHVYLEMRQATSGRADLRHIDLRCLPRLFSDDMALVEVRERDFEGCGGDEDAEAAVRTEACMGVSMVGRLGQGYASLHERHVRFFLSQHHNAHHA